jgi:hypothetical protein
MSNEIRELTDAELDIVGGGSYYKPPTSNVHVNVTTNVLSNDTNSFNIGSFNGVGNGAIGNLGSFNVLFV